MDTAAPMTTSGLPDMPVEWEQPGDAQLFFTLDPMHFPNQLTLLDHAFIGNIYKGFAFAAEHYSMPIRPHPRRFYTRHYNAMAPLPLPPEELHALGQRSEQAMGAAMADFKQCWDSEWLPELQANLEWWDRFDLKRASGAEFAAHWDESQERLARAWQIHFLLVLPAYLAMSLFDELYRDLLGGDTNAPFRLLQGFGNKTVDSGHAIWRLSRTALAIPAVRHALEQLPGDEVLPTLEHQPDAAPFLAELDAFLAEFGHQGGLWGISFRSWVEDPTPVIKNLKDFITLPDRDLATELAGLAVERERLIAEAREQLAGYPEAVRGQFEFLLAAAQAGVVLSEDHGYWIDFESTYRFRRVVLEAGRRLAASGAIASANDVFHVTITEIGSGLRAATDYRAVVAERQAEMERFRDVQAPPVIGAEPTGPPPDNPLVRANMKLFGTPPPPSDEPGVFKGAVGSSGVARGTARVVRSLADAARLQPGDILVAETTAPPWTPLFATAAAVVTDTGGILSHCAVVAREYGIPAVVGVGVATAMIPDGATIEVDGDNGTVRIIEIR
jgi:pyruvate,water dikinase